MKQKVSTHIKLKIEKLSTKRIIAFSKLVLIVSGLMIFLDLYNGYTGVWETHISQYYIFVTHLYTIPLLIGLIWFLNRFLKSDAQFNYRQCVLLSTLVYFPIVLPYFYIELNDYNIGSSISIYFLIFGLILNLDTWERIIITIYFGLFYFITPMVMGISYWEYPYHYIVGVALLALFFFVSKYVDESELIRFVNEEMLESQKLKLEALNQDLVNANQSVLSINQSLKESNKNLSNFASMAAHDIKSPLRTIGSFSQIISKRYKNIVKEKDLEYFQFINSSVNSLSTMIDQLLSFSKIPDPKSIELESVNLESLLDEVIKLLEHEISQHKVTINIPDQLPHLNGNKNLLKQLFLNLLSNAIKFSKNAEPNPMIDITFKEMKHSKVQLSIKDNGIGISPEYHSTIFELFRKLNSAHQFEGNGMGLALCKRIVLAHNGSIWVESKEGKGADFNFILDIHPEFKAYHHNLEVNTKFG